MQQQKDDSKEVMPPAPPQPGYNPIVMATKRKNKDALKALVKQLVASRRSLLKVAYPNEKKLLPRLY